MLAQLAVEVRVDINFLPNFGLDLVEFDEQLPSMKFNLNYEIEYLGSYLKYSNKNLWIECDAWDNWLAQITALKLEKRDRAVLHDMDNDFSITLTKKSADSFELEFLYKIDEFKKPITRISSTFCLSLDSINSLVSSSQDFPVMW